MELVKLLLEDVITTGTGAAFTPGQGEQYATPFAFGKRGGKKKRMPIIRKKLFEDTPYTAEAGEDEYKKLSTAVAEATSRVDRFINSFKGFSIEKMISSPDSVEQLRKLGERLYDNLGELHDTADELAWKAEEAGDKQGYTKYSQLTNVCRGLQESLSNISSALEAIVKATENIKAQNK